MSKLLFCLALASLFGGCSHGLSVRTPHPADGGSDGVSFAADGGPDGFVASSGADAGSPTAGGTGGAGVAIRVQAAEVCPHGHACDDEQCRQTWRARRTVSAPGPS